MIERLGNRFSHLAIRFVPDPFLIAIFLTAVAFLLAWGITDATAVQTVQAWGTGFWELLAFAMQMCLVLVTGHALATSGPIKSAINALAALPRSGATATALVALVASICGLVNWGLAIIVGALLARQVALVGEKRGLPFHYPLLAAAGYAGLLIWHGGLSGSAPLLVATKNHFLVKEIGVVPVSQTLFSPMNIVVSIAMLAAISVVAAWLHPKTSVKTVADFNVKEEEEETSTTIATTPSEKIETSRVVSTVAGLLGLGFLVIKTAHDGFKPDLNLVNLTFLSVGLLLHKNPRSYLNAVSDGAKACAGIIIQFPFYAGIMGIMKYTGLMKEMAEFASAHVGPFLLPVVTFFSAGLVNLFVPSGGGQWAVQGPIAVEVATQLHVSIPKAVMAVAYGDEWTNMLQPFWALALLGITRLRAGDIMGYTFLFLLISLPIFLMGLLFLPC